MKCILEICIILIIFMNLCRKSADHFMSRHLQKLCKQMQLSCRCNLNRDQIEEDGSFQFRNDMLTK